MFATEHLRNSAKELRAICKTINVKQIDIWSISTSREHLLWMIRNSLVLILMHASNALKASSAILNCFSCLFFCKGVCNTFDCMLALPTCCWFLLRAKLCAMVFVEFRDRNAAYASKLGLCRPWIYIHVKVTDKSSTHNSPEEGALKII